MSHVVLLPLDVFVLPPFDQATKEELTNNVVVWLDLLHHQSSVLPLRFNRGKEEQLSVVGHSPPIPIIPPTHHRLHQSQRHPQRLLRCDVRLLTLLPPVLLPLGKFFSPHQIF